MATPQLTEWCEKEGIVCFGIKPDFVEEGWRGLVATEAIEPDSVVLRVPDGALMTKANALRDPRFSTVLLGAGASLPSPSILSAFLLYEVSKGTESKWSAYLSQLPRSYSSFVYFDDAALSQLQLSYAADVASEELEKLRETWRAAGPFLKALGLPKKFLSLASWRWASATVASRTMYLASDPQGGALTPLGDLANYRPPPPPHTPCVVPPPPPLDAHRTVADSTSEEGSERAQEITSEQSDLNGVREDVTGDDVSSTGHAGTTRLGGALAVATAGATSGPSSVEEGEVRQWGTAAAAAVSGDEGPGYDTHSAAKPLTAFVGESPWPGQSPQRQGVPHRPSGEGSLRPPAPENLASSCHSGGEGEGASEATLASRFESPSAASPSRGSGTDSAESERTTAGEIIHGDGGFDDEAKSYLLHVRKRYLPGEQVFLCYGAHSNLELVQHYGFSMANQTNPHDTAWIPLNLLAAVVTAKDLPRFLQRWKMPPPPPPAPMGGRQGLLLTSDGKVPIGGASSAAAATGGDSSFVYPWPATPTATTTLAGLHLGDAAFPSLQSTSRRRGEEAIEEKRPVSGPDSIPVSVIPSNQSPRCTADTVPALPNTGANNRRNSYVRGDLSEAVCGDNDVANRDHNGATALLLERSYQAALVACLAKSETIFGSSRGSRQGGKSHLMHSSIGAGGKSPPPNVEDGRGTSVLAAEGVAAAGACSSGLLDSTPFLQFSDAGGCLSLPSGGSSGPTLCQFDCWVHSSGQPSWRLLEWMRWHAAAGAKERHEKATALAAGERLSVEGDVRVLTWLACVCVAILAGLPTSIDQDERLLVRSSGHHHCTSAVLEEATAATGDPAHVDAMEQREAATSDGLAPSQIALTWRLEYKSVLLRALGLAVRGLEDLQRALLAR